MKRRILSLVVTMAMLVTLLGISPLSVAAGTSGLYTYATKADGTIGITACDITATGDITIPQTIDGYTVTSISNWAFKDCVAITSVVIPEGVTSIGFGAFYNCANIKSIIVAESVDSIGYKAFWSCKNLTDIQLPDEMTTLDYAAFQYCESLEEIVIPRGVATLGGSMFNYCSALKTVTIPDTVTTIGAAAFKGCDVFDTVYFTGTKEEWNSVSVATENETLTAAKIYYEPYFTYEVRETAEDEAAITGTFEDAGENLAILSSIRGLRVTEVSADAFADMAITSVTIPKSVTAIGASAFGGCDKLTDVYYTGSEEEWNDVIIDSGNECLTNATVHFASIDPALYTYTVGDDGTATITGCDSAVSGEIVIPDTIDGYSVTAIASKAFYGCENITSIVVPDTVKTISFGAFMYCSKLESVVLSSEMTAIGNSLFSYCTNLNTITIPNSITTIGVSSFSNCTSLETVNYGGTKEEWAAITVNTGNDCLTNATINYTEKAVLVTGVTLDKETAGLYVGDVVTLIATIEPENATNKNVIWDSSDETVAIVEDGVVTALLAGETVVTVTTEEGNYTASCNISVKEPEPNSYTVEFYDYEGNIISTQTVIEGTSAEAPVLEDTDKYEFISWDQDFSNVTDNMMIKPVYNEVVNIIGVGVLDGITVELGEAVTAEMLSEEVTVYLADGTETVMTVAWNLTDMDFSEVGTYTVTGELEFTEPYKNPNALVAEIEVQVVAPEPEPVYYTVVFMADGVEIDSQEILEGGAAVAPEAPTKDGYEFTGWDTEEYICVMSDLTVNAVYEEISKYTVVFYDMDGEEISTQKVNDGTEVIAPEAPNVEGYKFVGWSEDFSVVESDLSIYAEYKKYYKVTFCANGVELETQEVFEGESATAPEAPEVEGYKFIGWDKEYSNVTGELVVTANYQAIGGTGGGSGGGGEETVVYISSITAPNDVTAINPESVAALAALFPKTVSATLSDGTAMEYSVTWEVAADMDVTVAGTHTIAGKIVLPDDSTLGEESVLDTQLVVIIKISEETDKYINVPSVVAQSGDEVTVTITIDEDPGMAFGNFMIDYDRDMLELVDYSFGAVIEDVNPIINTEYNQSGATKIFVSFMGVNDIMTGGELISLTFKVNETVSNETMIPVTVDGIQVYNANEEVVDIKPSNGGINVLNYTLADVNRDGTINLLDAFRILQYDVGLRTFSASEMLAADVNCDGVINVVDALRIQKYNAGLIDSL